MKAFSIGSPKVSRRLWPHPAPRVNDHHRGTHLALEKLDEDDRFANRVLEVPAGMPEMAIDIVIEGWWDQ